MTEIVVSPNICTFSDENLETLNIQIELPGVDRKDIDPNFYEYGFYVVARKEGTKYMGSYVCSASSTEKAIAKYANGLLAVNIPYKGPFEKGVNVKI